MAISNVVDQSEGSKQRFETFIVAVAEVFTVTHTNRRSAVRSDLRGMDDTQQYLPPRMSQVSRKKNQKKQR